MAVKFTSFDPAEALDSKEAIEVFVVEAFKSGDTAYIAASLGVVARSKGLSQLATSKGTSTEQFGNALLAASTRSLQTMRTLVEGMGLSCSTADLN